MDGIRQKLEIQRFSPTIYRQVIKPLDPAHIRGVSMEAVNFVEKRKYIYYGADVDNGTLIYKEVPDA